MWPQRLNSLAALYRATERDTEAEVLERRAEEPQEAAVKPPVQQPQDGAKPRQAARKDRVPKTPTAAEPQRPKAENQREDSQRVAKPSQRVGKGPLPEPQDVGKPRQRSEGPATGVAFHLRAGLDKRRGV